MSVNFHGAYAGKTVLIRFRYGFGWDEFDPAWLYELDNVALTGATNHPFLTDVNDRRICVPTPDAGADQTVAERTEATLHGVAPDLSGWPVSVRSIQLSGPAADAQRSDEPDPDLRRPPTSPPTPS